MYSQVDADGYVNNMLEKILYYKKDASTDNKEDMYITTKSGYRRIWKKNYGMEVIASMEEYNWAMDPFEILKWVQSCESIWVWISKMDWEWN